MRGGSESANETPEIAARLDGEKALTIERLANLRQDFAEMVEASADSNADDEHDPEGATIAYERSQLASVIHQVQGHLAEIELAHERLTNGTYDVCESCGQPISKARLEARPVARRCITCATLP